MKKRVLILSNRPIGDRCLEIARELAPKDWIVDFAPHTVPHTNHDVVISVLYAKIIEEFNATTRYYNFHPGILPQYAGSGTLSWSILNGETEAGCTLHELIRKVDGGNIIEIRKFPLLAHDTAETAAHKFTEIAEWMFRDWFVKLLDGEFPTHPQSTFAGTRRNYKRAEIAGQLDLTRHIRAFTFPGKEECFFVSKDGRRWELSFDRGVRVKTDKPEDL